MARRFHMFYSQYGFNTRVVCNQTPKTRNTNLQRERCSTYQRSQSLLFQLVDIVSLQVVDSFAKNKNIYSAI